MAETIYFHENSYGHNFRVTFNEEAGLTYVTRYWTNGHQNTDEEEATIFRIVVPTSYFEAEGLFLEYEQRMHLDAQELATAPQNGRGKKTRLECLQGRLKWWERHQYAPPPESLVAAINLLS